MHWKRTRKDDIKEMQINGMLVQMFRFADDAER